MLLSKSADGQVPGVQFRILEDMPAVNATVKDHTRHYTQVGDVVSFGAALEHASEEVRNQRVVVQGKVHEQVLPVKASKIAVFWRAGSALEEDPQ